MTMNVMSASVVLTARGNAVAAQGTQAPAGFDGNRAYEHLRQAVAFGPRPAGSAALAATRQVHQETARRHRHPGRRAGLRRGDAGRPRFTW